MEKILPLFLLFVLLSSCKKEMPVHLGSYPDTHRSADEDEYFGTTVKDPYRWLENDTSQQVANWVGEQNKVTEAYIKGIPYRNEIKSRLEKLWDFERFSSPRREGDYFYFSKNSGLQNQSVWYRFKNIGDKPEVFLDPNTFSEDGTTSLAGIGFSKDGKYCAYATSESGSDWRTIYVLAVESLQPTGDTIHWAKFTGITWQGKGFYYSSYDRPEEGKELSSFNFQHKVYYHELGNDQKEDEMVFGGADNPVRYASAAVSEDEKYLIIHAALRTSGNAVYFRDLTKDGPLIPLVESYENNFSFFTSIDDKLIFYTDYEAPNSQLLEIDPKQPGRNNWRTLVPEKEEVLAGLGEGRNKLFLTYLKDASSHVYQYSLSGKLDKEIALPEIGTIFGFGGKKMDDEIYFGFTSFTTPFSIFKYTISSGKVALYKRPEIDFDPELYETRQVFYKSKDGTQVPMFIVMKKGTILNGANPTYLYGYGGFNASMRPSFSVTRVLWLEQGGIFALPNIRGGGEYGKKWHEAGIKMKKQNVFDDFIAAAEYLIENKYTSSEKLSIFGGSNGGLLVGAAMTQRPELFKVAVPAVGVMDMLRYHKFTAGAGWIYDYGCADSSQAMFEYIKSYSPLHNIKKNISYPATLVKTADHDDRVVPAHSFKFISELQHKHRGQNPVLIRVETKAGHGAGKPVSMQIEDWADTFSFVFHNLGEKFVYDPSKKKEIRPKYD